MLGVSVDNKVGWSDQNCHIYILQNIYCLLSQNITIQYHNQLNS